MAYASQDITTLRYLSANVIYQATQGMLNAQDEKDTDILDDAVMLYDAITSYLTESDPVFALEWQAIQADRTNPDKAPYAPGEDRAQDQGFRYKELKAMIRSMCRKDQYVKHASPSTEWEVAE